MTFLWSKKAFFTGFIYSISVYILQYLLDIKFSIPWQPISVVGVAVAFYLGFKNNSSYDRTWEARKIWGAIVNSSRSFGAGVVAFVKGENDHQIKKELLYRHIGWLTALRHQLRVGKPWEHRNERVKSNSLPVAPEQVAESILTELKGYLPDAEIEQLASKTNIATQILLNQSVRLQILRDQGYFEDFRHMEFHHHITSFYTDQGKSERIKNFPLPRQYASTALWLTFVFCAMVPLGMNDIFESYENWVRWLAPLLSALLIWVFFLMEKIGDYSENPFEGSYNDVPITTIARGIEIDLREMIDDSDIPGPVVDENGFLM